jgi:hypothetical protein
MRVSGFSYAAIRWLFRGSSAHGEVAARRHEKEPRNALGHSEARGLTVRSTYLQSIEGWPQVRECDNALHRSELRGSAGAWSW